MQSAQASASYFTCVAEIFNLNPVTAKVAFIRQGCQNVGSNVSGWKGFLTHRMVKALHVCSNQTLALSQRKYNLLPKAESHCSSPAVNRVGEQVSEGRRKDQP